MRHANGVGFYPMHLSANMNLSMFIISTARCSVEPKLNICDGSTVESVFESRDMQRSVWTYIIACALHVGHILPLTVLVLAATFGYTSRECSRDRSRRQFGLC